MSQVKRLETDLAVIIQNRRWRKFSSPFKHILARNVFIPTFYRELESAFAEALRSAALGTSRFRYNGTSMDAFDLTFDRDVATPFSTFFSNTWLQLLGGLFDLCPCRYVSGGLHH